MKTPRLHLAATAERDGRGGRTRCDPSSLPPQPRHGRVGRGPQTREGPSALEATKPLPPGGGAAASAQGEETRVFSRSVHPTLRQAWSRE